MITVGSGNRSSGGIRRPTPNRITPKRFSMARLQGPSFPYTAVRATPNIRLPRADRGKLQKALEDAGFTDERAQRLAREAHPEKWLSLLEDFAKLSPAAQAATLKWLHEIDISLFSENARVETWKKTRELVEKASVFL